MNPIFVQLNQGWNAEPNAPNRKVRIQGDDLQLQFLLNYMIFPGIQENDIGILRLMNCERYRLGTTNDEGWYLGQCRYSKAAPAWGEFYEISGEDTERLTPTDWILFPTMHSEGRHFLFYFRDETFECVAADWLFQPSPENALIRLKSLD